MVARCQLEEAWIWRIYLTLAMTILQWYSVDQKPARSEGLVLLSALTTLQYTLLNRSLPGLEGWSYPRPSIDKTTLLNRSLPGLEGWSYPGPALTGLLCWSEACWVWWICLTPHWQDYSAESCIYIRPMPPIRYTLDSHTGSLNENIILNGWKSVVWCAAYYSVDRWMADIGALV